MIGYIYFEYSDIFGNTYSSSLTNSNYSVSNIPDYDGKDIIYINNNEPNFIDKEYSLSSYEIYGELDSLGRCTSAFSNIGKDLMPTSERGSIKNIKPTGFQISKYSIIKDGLYLYNRCHLIGYQLTGENDNIKNLITCTRHMNVELMEPYENKVASYIRKTGNHVLYRVTPVFENDNLVAKGVHMEALSVEDEGNGIKFNIFLYNIQPGIYIDYKTGDNKLINE